MKTEFEQKMEVKEVLLLSKVHTQNSDIDSAIAEKLATLPFSDKLRAAYYLLALLVE